MSRAARSSASGDGRPRPIPLEDPEAGAWHQRVVATLTALLTRPSRSFAVCPEPIAHGPVLRLMATLRLPSWVVLVGLLAAQYFTATPGQGMPSRALDVVLDPSLVRVGSLWLLLMIPVGMPLLYFVEGLVAHIGVALTGGASRSIGASMRACGYALAPALLVIGLVDIPLYTGLLGGMSFESYAVVLGLMAWIHWILVGVGLARTHQIRLVRGLLVGLVPTLVLVAATAVRVLPEMATVPLLPAPGSPYALP